MATYENFENDYYYHHEKSLKLPAGKALVYGITENNAFFYYGDIAWPA